MSQPTLGKFGLVRAVACFLWQGFRWKALRGSWYFRHAVSHRPFRQPPLSSDSPVHVVVAIVDHFEPPKKKGDGHAIDVVGAWCDAYRQIADCHRDADGRRPQHTWFYRFEYHNSDCVRLLSDEVFRGYGEVEFHLHHGYDTHETFSEKLRAGLALGNQFGAMITAEDVPKPRFAYIAGNWSLDNGSRDPSLSGCSTELRALREAGCFADFTFPACGSRAQPRMTNCVYYAADHPGPKSYDTGVEVEIGGSPSGDLMIIQGPLLFDWRAGRFECGDLEDYSPPSRERMDAWLRANVQVRGRPDWILVKLHTHGIQSRSTFLGPALDALFEWMETSWNRPPFSLHYVTAREMYNIVRAAEAGQTRNPGLVRDWTVARPGNRCINCDQPWKLLSYRAEGLIELALRDSTTATIQFLEAPGRVLRGKFRAVRARVQAGKIAALEYVGELAWIKPQRDATTVRRVRS